MIWQVALAAVIGAALGFAGGKIAPRWLDQPPQPWAVYSLAAVNAIFTALLAYRHPLTTTYFWHQFLFIAILSLAAFVDLYKRIIPDEVVLFGLAAGVLLLLAAPYPEKSWLSALGGGAAGFAFLLFLALLVPGGMGMGDVKLSAVLGLFLGINWIGMGMVLSFLVGGLLSGVLLLFKSVGRKSHIPFGPFLSLGHIITVIFGWEIWVWYMQY